MKVSGPSLTCSSSTMMHHRQVGTVEDSSFLEAGGTSWPLPDDEPISQICYLQMPRPLTFPSKLVVKASLCCCQRVCRCHTSVLPLPFFHRLLRGRVIGRGPLHCRPCVHEWQPRNRGGEGLCSGVWVAPESACKLAHAALSLSHTYTTVLLR